MINSIKGKYACYYGKGAQTDMGIPRAFLVLPYPVVNACDPAGPLRSWISELKTWVTWTGKNP